jgi:hypothetical protein
VSRALDVICDDLADCANEALDGVNDAILALQSLEWLVESGESVVEPRHFHETYAQLRHAREHLRCMRESHLRDLATTAGVAPAEVGLQ